MESSALKREFQWADLPIVSCAHVSYESSCSVFIPHGTTDCFSEGNAWHIGVLQNSEGDAAECEWTHLRVSCGSSALHAALSILIFILKVKISIVTINNGQVCIVNLVCESQTESKPLLAFNYSDLDFAKRCEPQRKYFFQQSAYLIFATKFSKSLMLLSMY